MNEEEERKKQEEIKRKQEEEIRRKKQEEERKRKEEERKKQEEIKRKQEEERKKQEELKRKKEEEIKRKQEEERKKREEIKRKKEEELKKKINESKKRQLENLMQKSSYSNSNASNSATKLKNKIKNKNKFVSCLSKNSILLKNALNALSFKTNESPSNKSDANSKKYKRSFSVNPKKVTLPSLIFPLKIAKNFDFSYSYRSPTDENGNIIEDAPFDPKNIVLDELDIFKKSEKSAFKSINIKSKTTNEVIDYKKDIQTKKVCEEVLSHISDQNQKHGIKKIIENAIANSKLGSVSRAEDLIPFIEQTHINEKNIYNFNHQQNNLNQNTTENSINNQQLHPTFLSDSFINNSYNFYRNDTTRQALFLLSNQDDSSNSTSIIALNDFVIDEICAKHGDVDYDANGKFRTRYERLQRQSKIKFILAKTRRYNPQNRPQKLDVDNLVFHEWTVHISSDDDDLYEYYDYE